MIKNIMDIKLNVKPLFSMFAHKYYFEGPCRMAGGDALQPGFDEMVNGAIFNGTMEGIKHSMPDCVNLMEPVYLETTCDWDIKDEYFAKLLADNHEVDVYLAMGQFGADQVFNEFATRANKPIIMQPDLWGPARAGALYSLGVDVICELTWADVAKQLIVLRAQKCLREANLLLVPRFNQAIPVAGATDSFIDLGAVTKKLGIHFRTVNAHEIMDELHLKFYLDPEDCFGQSMTQMADKSIERMIELKMPIAKDSERATTCGMAGSAAMKIALVYVAVKKDFEADIPPGKLAFVKTSEEVGALVYEALHKR